MWGRDLSLSVSTQCLHSNQLILIALSAYEIRQGTVKQTKAEREWVLSHYMQTARKRSMLSNSTASRSGNDEQADARPSKKRSR